MLIYNLKTTYKSKQTLTNVLDDLKKLKIKLNKAKHQLDVGFRSKGFVNRWRDMDPFKKIRYYISKKYEIEHVTNATLKAIEIFTRFKLIDKGLYFDNAALPGSFIIVYKYLCGKLNIDPNWVASSLQDTKSAISDQFKLIENNPDNWLMSDQNNGDVCVGANQLDWKNRLGASVSLYTSDLGFQTSYDNQEEEHQRANIGQIVCGLNVLSIGGHMVIKMYTSFTYWSIYLLWLLSSSFTECYWCKPQTSRLANSETYVVCKGYLGCEINPEDLLTKQQPETDIPESFLAMINKYNHELFIGQINALDHQVLAAWKNDIPDHKTLTNKWLKTYME